MQHVVKALGTCSAGRKSTRNFLQHFSLNESVYFHPGLQRVSLYSLSKRSNYLFPFQVTAFFFGQMQVLGTFSALSYAVIIPLKPARV